MSDLPIEGTRLNPGGFIAQAINEGYGVTAARSAFREAGGALSNETFGRMFGEIREAIGNRDVIAGLDYDAIPGGDVYSDWAAGAEGDYASFVTSFVRVPGQADVEQRFYIHTTSEPHTPQEAVDAAATFYTDDAETKIASYGGVYQGSVVTSMTRTVGGG